MTDVLPVSTKRINLKDSHSEYDTAREAPDDGLSRRKKDAPCPSSLNTKAMMNKSLLLMLCAVLSAVIQPARAGDDTTVQSLVAHSDKFNRVLPQEKVYLHFDNTGYFMEETIWFKAYVVSSDSNRYTSKSRVLYVELLNPSGDVVSEKKLEIKDGQAHGDFVLHDLFMTGFYEVRAYTRYMLNWGGGAVFSRVFPVFKEPARAGDYSRKAMTQTEGGGRYPDNRGEDSVKSGRMNVDFYPEGGSLIRGLESRVAFSVYDRDGSHFETDGFLVSGGDTLCAVRTLREGRGVFSCVPGGGEVTLHLRGKKGGWRKFRLPEARSEGCALRVDASGDDSVRLRMEFSRGLEGSKIGLVISYHGSSEVCDSMIAGSGAVERVFSRSVFAEGVNEVSVFDTSGRILADRMFFVHPRGGARRIEAEVDDRSLSPFSKVRMRFRTPDSCTVFSLSVRDADTEVNGSGTDAATWHLLASDLRGYIENAGYYLEGDDPARREAADLLMLVQGWRGYDFEMMSGRNRMHLTHPAEDGLLLMGQLHPYKKKDSVAFVDLAVALRNAYEDLLLGTTTTDRKGYYTFRLPDCYNEWDMVMRTSIEDKNMKYYIGINRNFSPAARKLSYYEMQPLPLDTPRIYMKAVVDTSRIIVTQDVQLIQEVVIKGKRYRDARASWERESYGSRYATLAYFCAADVERIIDKGEKLPSLYEWLQSKNEFFVGNDNISNAIPYKNPIYNYWDDGPSYRNRPILWFLDNEFMFATSVPRQYAKTPHISEPLVYDEGLFPVFIDEVKSVYVSEKPLDVRHIKNNKMVGYNYVCVYVYLQRYKRAKVKGMRFTHFDGYYTPQTFVSPNYSILPPEPDFRRTLYWNPDVKTDGEGKADIEFYNSSKCRQFIISAETITKDGKALVY